MAKKIPENLRECIVEFCKQFPEAQINALKDMKREDLFRCHFGLGLFIRNNWLYPSGSSLMQKFNELNAWAEVDNFSSLIVEFIWLDLNKVHIEEEELVQLLEMRGISKFEAEPFDEETVKKLLGTDARKIS